MDDRLVGKLARMAVRRELRERRLSLAEGLEILSDLQEAGDGEEAARWRTFVMDAHARRDFGFTFELNRKEWAAVMHGRLLPVWSQPELTLASSRFQLVDSATWARDAKPNPGRDAIYAEMQSAARTGRVMSGPGGSRVMFRSMTDRLRDESPEEMADALDRKVAIRAAAAEINTLIDATLERVAAKLTNGESVLPTVGMLDLLERTINAIAETPSGALAPVRFTDGAIPRWTELLRTYEDAWSKVGSGRINRAVDLTRKLEAVWNRDDEQARKLAESVTGSPDPLPAELLAVERGLAGVFVSGRA